MVKKGHSKTKTHKKSSRSTHKKIVHKPHKAHTSSGVKVEKLLINNFVELQKVMTSLCVKFDGLTNQISKLLELFEKSAKSLSEKDFSMKTDGDNKKILEKMDSLLDQNKTIAKGMALMYEDTTSPSHSSSPMPSQAPPGVQSKQTDSSLQPSRFKPLPKEYNAQTK